MEIKLLSRKTSGGLFLHFEVLSPSEEEMVDLTVEPAGRLYRALEDLEEEMRRSGKVLESPGTGLEERSEGISDTFYIAGGYFEVRDEASSESLLDGLRKTFPGVDLDVEYR